ncbi:uncharacterized protein LOC18429434 isoform X1 [Amborella trichopoda]|uniref:AMP-activated protein kinase glycogen-binding domain-containing protein n=1 Tax=Amborella trichopoda TaxID=13333 RepID=W1NUP7_AMBTC|nr:uncharacterized protein LOC18429434 isoform X1 [Amborella trichopoda]ERN01352.1 hypothetical protein AMTR_s00002p00258790 [Amborella trichopoda]|eukprot:XP_006838783.1 uncharacterized protein LOC18429434 isoform X1 [Amborella trichopoda]
MAWCRSLYSSSMLNLSFENPSLCLNPKTQTPKFKLLAMKEQRLFSSLKGSRFRLRCWVSDYDMDLEREIFYFMENSKKPNLFPTKEELIEAGRMDLVDRIVSCGGWLASGWNLEEEEEVREEKEEENEGDSGDLITGGDDELGFRDINEEFEEGYGSNVSVPSSSGRSIEMESSDSGVEGILSRLERERSFSYREDSREKRRESKDDNSWGRLTELFGGKSMEVAGPKKINGFRSLNLKEDMFADSEVLYSPLEAHSGPNTITATTCTVQTPWIIENFSEDDQISMSARKESNEGQNDGMSHIGEKINGFNGIVKGSTIDDQDSYQKRIRSRIQSLESELNSMLNSLRSQTNTVDSRKSPGGSLDELHKLSDAWEFQENEIMNTRSKLRSTHAKLTVLEGKMALEIVEAQKLIEKKQRRIEEVQKVLRLLHDACIVWPNPGSEVLLAGSFDGWTSQRRMERSSAGVFTLNLKLYPGRYEIKFVVDGVWRVDPQRPIVYNNSVENNLLIIC